MRHGDQQAEPLHTYRVMLTLELEITSRRPRTAAQLEAIAGNVVANGQAQERTRVFSVDEAWCAALNRRNSVDGRLYTCQMAPSHSIHGSVEACSAERGEPCDRPGDHHAWVSPGWESPIAAPVAVAS